MTIISEPNCIFLNQTKLILNWISSLFKNRLITNSQKAMFVIQQNVAKGLIYICLWLWLLLFF